MAGIASDAVDDVDATVDSHTVETINGIRVVHTMKLGLILSSHTSTISGILTRKLGLVRSHASTITATPLIRKLGLVRLHISTKKTLLTRKLGLIRSFLLGPRHTYLTRKLGLIRSSHTSIISGVLTRKLGLIRSHASTIAAAPVVRKLGFIRSHVSTITGIDTRKLGLIRSHASTISGILTRTLGFVRIHVSVIYKFIIDLKFYNRSGTLVKIISSKSQNFPLIEPGLDFQFLRDGGCGPFSFTVSEDLGLEYNYRCDIYLYDTKWFSGYLTRLPQVGTGLTYRYEGWGFFEQIDWQTINETETGVELSVIVEDYLDTYITPNTSILKGA